MDMPSLRRSLRRTLAPALLMLAERFAGGAIVAGVPYGCADTVSKALQCMRPGVDQTPAEWARRVRLAGGTIPPARSSEPEMALN
jgi:poly(3-hydroxybutyrate) depolymerase